MRPIGPIGLIGLITLIALTGCSGEIPEPVSSGEQLEPIAFAGGIRDTLAETRATSLHDEGISSFHVWAYKNQASYTDGYQTVINDYTVSWADNSAATSTTNTSGWEYLSSSQTIKYWDYAAGAYRFFGYAPSTAASAATVEVSVGSGSAAAATFAFAANATNTTSQAAAPYLSTLWYSTGAPSAYPDRLFGRPVQLQFVKPFARVRFLYIYATADAESRTTIAGSSFKPAATERRIYLQGRVTVTYPITGTATRETWSVSGDDSSSGAYLTGLTVPYTDDNTKWYDVLPASDQGPYTLTATVNGQERTATVPAEFMTWQPGYQYTYVFKVNDDGSVEIGGVQSAFRKWTEETKTHNIYNW